MKKNFVRVMLFGALTLAVTTTVTSCKDYDDDIKGLQEQVDKITSASPVSTEDMNAAVDKASKELKEQLAKLEKLVNDPSSETSLTQQIADLKEALKTAVGEDAKNLAGKLAAAQNDLKALKTALGGDDYIKGLKKKIDDLETAKATLADLIAAEKEFDATGKLDGYNETGLVALVNQQIMDAFSTEGTPSSIAKYVSDAIKSQIAVTVKTVKFPFGTEQALGDIITKIYDDIYKDRDAVQENFGKLDDLLSAIDGYVGIGEGKYADYDAIIKQINDTKNDLAALLEPTGSSSLTEKVKGIIADELKAKDSDLKKMENALLKEINAIKGMIQSIVYVPESADRTINFASLKVLIGFNASNGFTDASNTKFEKKVKFRVAPSSAVQYLVSGENQKYEISIDAQKLTRSAAPFSITNVAAVDGEENLIEVTMVADDAFADVNGFATSLIVKGKEVAAGKDKELSDLSSDYFAIVKQAVYIVDVAYSYADMPTSLIKGSADAIDFGNNGIITFTTVPTAADKSDNGKKATKTAAELGIDASIATTTFAMTGTNVADNFDFNTDATKKDLYVLKPKATGTAGGEATITPTIVVVGQSKTATAMTIKLIEKSEKVDLVVKPITWAAKEQTIAMTDDNLKAIEAAISKTADDLSAIQSVTDNKSTAKDNAITFELANQGQANAAITLKVPAKAETQTVTAVLKLNTKEINLSAVITVDETKPDVFKWDKKPLLGDVIPLTINTTDNAGKVSKITLEADLADVYVNFATWNTMANTDKKITLNCVAAPNIGKIDNSAYSYSLPATTALPKGTTSVSSIDVTYNVMCNKTSLNPANKENVVTYSVPVEELNGKLSVPAEKLRAKDVAEELSAAYALSLTTAFNPEEEEVAAEEPAEPKLLWNDAEGKAMWPTADNEKYGSSANVLPIYGLGISFESADAASKTFIETYFDKGELAKGNLKFSGKGLAALPNTLGTDLIVKLKVVATSKWGDVANSGTVFTVTFKKGCTVNKTVE